MTKRAPPAEERRQATMRRQFNESFTSPDGRLSISKTIAICGQVACLYYLGRYFDLLIAKPESLLIVVLVVIAPELLKKFLNMRFGNSHNDPYRDSRRTRYEGDVKPTK